MYSIEYLKKKSNLPGPRVNLTLLYDFSVNSTDQNIKDCLEYLNPELKNSPEEFIGMCGILSYSIKNQSELKLIIPFLKVYANHKSWRIREAVAMSIQEISKNRINEIIIALKDFINGSDLEKRAVVAGFCEPKLLDNKDSNIALLEILLNISKPFNHDNKLKDDEIVLRKALGYCWSVLVCKIPNEGKLYFEKLLLLNGKHIKWIIKENSKKSRLKKMDLEWVEYCQNELS